MALRAAVALALVLLAGCGDDDPTTTDRPSPHAEPTSAADCVDLPHLDGDPGILLGTDWSGEDHDYGDTVVVLACAAPGDTGALAITADGTGIDVAPSRVRLADADGGVARFEVVVGEGAIGRLRVRLTGPGVTGDLGGPEVVTDDDGWHFERSD